MIIATLDFVARRGGRDEGHFFFPLLLVTLLIGAIAFVVIRRRAGSTSNHAARSALATLQDRFARGEIDQREYDHRRAVLDGDENVPPAPPRAPAAPTPPPPTPAAPAAPETGATATAVEPDPSEAQTPDGSDTTERLGE